MRIFTTINEFFSAQQYESAIQRRLDNIFDTIEEYKKEGLEIEVKMVDIDSWRRFNEDYLYDIEEFIEEINLEGKIMVCDFPSFIVTSMDKLSSGEVDEEMQLHIDESKVRVDYKYTHVYRPYTIKKYEYECQDKYSFDYFGMKDELGAREVLELLETGVHHSEYGILGFAQIDGKYNAELTEKKIKEYVSENFG